MSKARTYTPPTTVAVDDSSAIYNVAPLTYLLDNPQYDVLISGAVVFHEDRVLLIQRAAHDSMPNLWETPGGAVDSDDATILHGVARELWEEAGLTAARVGECVGIFEWIGRQGHRAVKYSFVVEVEGGNNATQPALTLDPEEHQAFVWATEDDVLANKSGDVDLNITTRSQRETILRGFEVRKARSANINASNAT